MLRERDRDKENTNRELYEIKSALLNREQRELYLSKKMKV